MWDRQIPELTRNWRVLRFDLPGHGGAPAHPADSATALAERLLATLDSLGINRFGYVGCSIGGAIGIQLGLLARDRLSSLALISTSPRFGTADAWRQRGVVVRTNGLDPIARATPDRWFTESFVVAQPAIVEWAVQMVRTTDPGCYIAACEVLAAFDVRDELGSIGVPTLVMAGAEDEATPPSDARGLVAGIPDARLAIVPGASHLTPVEQPGAVTELLIRHFTTSWQESPAGPPAPAPVIAFTPQRATGAIAELESADPAGRTDTYDAGMKVRREVLGDAHVDRAQEKADDFTQDFQDFVTRYAWGEVWTRPGLDRRTRSVITLTALISRGHFDELSFHIRAALRNGLTPEEIKEILLQTAVYAGVPAANSAFALAQGIIREETTPDE
jgi:3-oxoadipate enol-lactonase/4-carboxymuconolactone decarboxylase